MPLQTAEIPQVDSKIKLTIKKNRYGKEKRGY